MEVIAVVDVNEVNENLKRFKSDKKYAGKIREQEKQLQGLEEKIRKMQQQLSNDDFDKTSKIRLERKKVFSKIDELEKIKSEIKQKTTLAIENIELGMTPQEVIKIAGDPRSKGQNSFNYGNVWVIFASDIVQCIVNAKNFSSGRSCYSYELGHEIIK